MSEIKLAADLRTEFGKGAARRVRRADRVPAVLYGHGTDPIHISLPGHDTLLALRNANALLSVEVAGKSHLALAKQVQRDVIRGTVEHVDLVIVRRGEQVSVDVPVAVVGEQHPDAMVVTENATLSLKVSATNIPESIEVSVEGVEPGTQILAGSLTLPEGAVLDVDPELLVVNVSQAPTADQIEAELAEAEAEAGIEPTLDDESEAEAAAESEPSEDAQN